MTRTAPIAAAALLGAIAAAGMAGAQEGRPPAPLAGPMMIGPGRGGIDFAAIDTDGNGSLSRAELVARATERLAAADADGDGTLDRAEIIAAMPGSRGRLFNLFAPDPAEAAADRLLAMLGATETGQVTVADLAGQRVNFLLAFADTDRDAAISQAEADAMRAAHRSRMERHRHGRGPGHGGSTGPASQDRG